MLQGTEATTETPINLTTTAVSNAMLRLGLVILLLASSCNGRAQGPDDSYLLENVNYLDVTNNTMLSGKSILIEADTIQQILNAGESPDVKVDKRIDMTGKYVLPGLFDMHVHLATDPSGTDQLDTAMARLSKYLDHGVTGVRDMAGDTRQLAFLARQAALDQINSPDVYYSALMAGPEFFSDPRTAASAQGHEPGKTSWMRAIDHDTNIALAVAEAKGTGATGIKLYADLPADLCAAIIKEARIQGIKVWAHASVLPALPQDLVNADIHSVSHSPLLDWQTAGKVAESGFQRYNRAVLNVEKPQFTALMADMAQKQVFLDPTVKIYASRELLYDNAVKGTIAAYEAGVPLVMGTDMALERSGVEHFPIIDEMELWVNELGIPAIEVIKAATLNSAILLGIDHEVGSIAVGKKANLLVLSANPLDDIKHIRQVAGVIKNGSQVK